MTVKRENTMSREDTKEGMAKMVSCLELHPSSDSYKSGNY